MTAPIIAVTGGTGFVGRAIIAELLRREYDVVSLVRTPDPEQPAMVRQVCAGDLNDPDYGAVLPAGVAAIIHCAARVHVMHDDAADPLAEMMRANAAATVALGRHAVRQGVGRFVYLSSIKVNGERTERDQLFHSDDRPAPQDPYGVSKWRAEEALRELAAASGIGVTVIRPPLVYGAGVKGNFALLSRLLRSGLPVPLGGITDNRRSLLALGNLADLAVVCAAHPEAVDRTFLASDGEDLSTTSLLRRMAAAMGCKARLLPAAPAVLRLVARAAGRPAIVERLCGSLRVDSSPTRQLLGWTPPLSVQAGLAAAFAPR